MTSDNADSVWRNLYTKPIPSISYQFNVDDTVRISMATGQWRGIGRFTFYEQELQLVIKMRQHVQGYRLGVIFCGLFRSAMPLT